MPALDFPNSPTNGQQYSAPNGAIYTYDGVAWTVSGVLSTGSAAGGSLAGTYPNPSIAPGAISPTELALGASVRQFLVTVVPVGFSITTTGAWVDIVTKAMTTTAPRVMIIGLLGAYATATAAQTNIALIGLGRDATSANITGIEQRFSSGAGTTTVPIGSIFAVDYNVPAGAHTYHLMALLNNTNLSITGAATWAGDLYLIELS